MIGLPETYRFAVYNGSGVNLVAGAAKVYARRRKINPADGALVYEGAEATVFSNASDIAHGTFLAGSTISNATDKWLSGDFIFEVTLAGAPTSDVVCYLERSTDSGTTHWPTAHLGAIVGKLGFAAAATLRMDFSL